MATSLEPTSTLSKESWLGSRADLAAVVGILLGLVARLARREFYAFAIPLVCIPILAPLAGTVNNDSLALLGGAVATLGAWQLAATDRTKWLTVALAGLAVSEKLQNGPPNRHGCTSRRRRFPCEQSCG